MGSLVLDALLETVGRHSDSDGCAVATECVTAKGNRIDIVVELDDLVIGIENKVNADLYNDLPDYMHLIETIAGRNVGNDGAARDALLVVLHAHPRLRFTDTSLEGFIQERDDVADVSYAALFNQVLQGLGPLLPHADPRAVDVLTQYIENYTQGNDTMSDDTKALTFFIHHTKGAQGQAVANVLTAYRDYRRACKDRLAAIADRLDGEHRLDARTVTLERQGNMRLLGYEGEWEFCHARFQCAVEGCKPFLFELMVFTPWAKPDEEVSNGIPRDREDLFNEIWYKAYTDGNNHQASKLTDPLNQRLDTPLDADIDKIVQDIIHQLGRIVYKVADGQALQAIE